MDYRRALGAMGTASYDRIYRLCFFLSILGIRCTIHMVTRLLFCPVHFSAFFYAPDSS